MAVADRLFSAADPVAELRRVLDDVPVILAAIRLASVSLHKDLTRWIKDGRPKNPSAPIKGLLYVLRMAGRPTPYGLFGAIGAVAVGESGTLAIEPRSLRASVRPDMGWLYGYLRSAASESEAASKIPFYVNDLRLRRGDRLWLADTKRQLRTHGNIEYGKNAISTTDAIEFIENVEQVESREALELLLTREFSVSRDRAAALVQTLDRVGYLRANVLPAPIGDVRTRALDVLERISPSSASLVGGVYDALDGLAAVAPDSWNDQRLIDVETIANGTFDCGRYPFQVDMGITFSGTLPAAVVREVESLANATMRMGQLSTALETLRAEYTLKYEGTDALVPLLELVDPDFGLRVPDILRPPSATGTRSSGGNGVIGLAADAIRDGVLEVNLTHEQYNTLLPESHMRSSSPPSIEISFRIHSASLEALNAGDFLVAPGSWPGVIGAGRSLGRFLHLLPHRTTEVVRALCERNETEREVIAELVYLPPDAGTINKSARPRVCKYELQIGIHDASDNIIRLELDDLYVGLREDRFYLWSASLQREVKLRESHLLLLIGGPSIIRFLARLQRDGIYSPGAFPWGAAMLSPFTPRVRYGRAVLSPARWRYPIALLTRSDEDAQRELTRFIERWNVPNDVLLVDGDISVPIRLSSPEAIALLRAAMPSGTEHFVLEEQFGLFGSGWLASPIGAYANEFVATLSQGAIQTNSPVPRPPAAIVSCEAERAHSPLSSWTYVRIDCANVQMDDILQQLSPHVERLNSSGTIEKWFFVRYADPHSHLRLRFKASRGHEHSLRLRIHEMVHVLEKSGVASRYRFETYLREVERYGGFEGIDACEDIFAYDTAAYLASLPAIVDQGPNLRTQEAIFGAADLVKLIYADNLSGWLDRCQTARTKLSPHDREQLKRLRRTAATRREAANGETVAHSLRNLSASNTLSRALDDIVSAILHMHFNRYGVGGIETQVTALLYAHLRSEMLAPVMR